MVQKMETGKGAKQMEELIRKQDALDALMKERQHLLANNQPGAEHILTHHGYNVIDDLPTVQPETIHCKDCKHHWTHRCMDSTPIEVCDLNQTFYDAEVDFCSLAEKRGEADGQVH